MSEKFLRPKAPAAEPAPVTPEQPVYSGEELAAQFLQDHPELAPRTEGLRDCAPEILEYQAMLADFESTYPIAEMIVRAIFTPEEVEQKNVWFAARRALGSISAKLAVLKNETTLSAERHTALYAEYRRLSRAVGLMQGGVLDHTR